MACLSPITVKHGDLVARVRCGQCRACRLVRQSSWVGRMTLERLDHKDARFLTLTFADAPDRVEVDQLQGFMKRYRHHFGPCRFFGVGEYGGKSNRPHWHVVIFGHPPARIGLISGPDWKFSYPCDEKMLMAWPYGGVSDGTAERKSFRYVAGYTMKPSVPGYPSIVRMSLKPGIGYARIERLAQAAAKFPIEVWPDSFNIAGYRYPLCDGGLVMFKRAFLNAGGQPPVELTPEERHIKALAELGSMGTRIEQGRRARAISYRDVGGDRYGTKKTSR